MAEGSEFESQWYQDFSFLHIAQIGCGAHAAIYKMGNRGSFSREKSWSMKLTTHLEIV
jgi:hypothetical protein